MNRHHQYRDRTAERALTGATVLSVIALLMIVVPSSHAVAGEAVGSVTPALEGGALATPSHP